MRRQSREITLQILFQTEFAPQISFAEFLSVFQSEGQFDKETLEYAETLIRGIAEKKTDIDSLIAQSSAHWKMDRMAIVDRNIMRIAVYEMRFSAEIITAQIAINEAVEISKKYGSEETPSFVNGILDQVTKIK
ncbi:MAG: transcription antitermination factor NusB [Pseudobdellovibrionaceae bacterium]